MNPGRRDLRHKIRPPRLLFHLFSIPLPCNGSPNEAPAPGEPPFVKVGDEVAAGETLCIVEAMKLMNEIVAETDGQIVEICAQNGQVVDFGCPLFRIK